MSFFISIGNGDSIIERTFVRKTKADGSRLHARNTFHCGEALVNESPKGGRIAVARIVERKLRCHHACWIKAGRQRLQVHKRAEQQPCASQ